MVRCNFGDLFLACSSDAPEGDTKSSKLCDLSSFLAVTQVFTEIQISCAYCSIVVHITLHVPDECQINQK